MAALVAVGILAVPVLMLVARDEMLGAVRRIEMEIWWAVRRRRGRQLRERRDALWTRER